MMTLNDIKNLPAVACSLQGGYLIEASAGTGKTWTLTGIILRLLVEKKYSPEKIIATTFTRAAASELQERVQNRLSDFYHYLHWLNNAKEDFPAWFNPDNFKKEQTTNDIIEQIINHAKNYGIASYDDPINIYLIIYLLSGEAYAIQIAIRHISLLLATLDKLFIGTLDSLAQKWLTEFATEMSYQPQTQINTDSDGLTRSLIHDALRAEHFAIIQSSPKIYDLIGADIFSNIDGLLKEVNLALRFYTAPIDETKIINDGIFNAIDDWAKQLLLLDWSVFTPFYDVQFAKNYGFSASLTLTKTFAKLQDVLTKIEKYRCDFFFYLTDDELKFIDKLPDIYKSNFFKKGFESNAQEFYALPIDDLMSIYVQVQNIKNIKIQYRSYLYRKIALSIRNQLKIQLENIGQSTFTFQMVRLIEALEVNPALARHIRYLYPVMLVDESQDINGLQVDLIYHTHLKNLSENQHQQKLTREFLLLVGDPKQAIYRFRGGDVANYNLVKNYGKDENGKGVLNDTLNLTVNRRSNSALIDVLNQWFISHQDSNNATYDNHAYLGDGIYYRQINALNTHQKLSWQNHKETLPDYLTTKTINILYMENKDIDNKDGNEFMLLARHINSILQSGYTIIDDNGISRTINPMDIAILSRDKKSLEMMKIHLNRLNISAISPNDVNIFTTQASKDLYHLLTLVMDSANSQKMGVVLTSSLFGMNMNQSMDIIQNHTFIFAMYLKYARDLFYKYGVASCLNFCLQNNPFKNLPDFGMSSETLWQQIAKQGERYLTDVWQLTELIIRQDGLSHNKHELYLLSWFERMMEGLDNQDCYKQTTLPSETGVHLMTIHKAKGLEFPIVYILGLDKAPIDNYDVFYPYSDENFHRKISANLGNDNDATYYYDKNYQEEVDEHRRLGYVALTRASEQIFIFAKSLVKDGKTKDRPLFLWFENKDKQLSLPDRLKDGVGWIDIAHCQDLSNVPYQQKEQTNHLIKYLSWQEVFAISDFYGSHTTSATALMNQYDGVTHQNDDDYHDNNNDYFTNLINTTIITPIAYPKNDIRIMFEKGITAGTFLHKLLQVINPDNKEHISSSIDRMIKTLGFNTVFANSFGGHQEKNKTDIWQVAHQGHQELLEWVWQITHKPMLSSGISLADLPHNAYIKEMSFMLGIGDGFNIDKLNHIFATLSDKEIKIDNDNPDVYYEFLKGEIDLVYEYRDKFYIVDYKSNYLGGYLSDYHKDNLEIAIQDFGYWIQACVYQVALHRLLKIRIKDYVGNEEKYLGGVEFIFLRGIDMQYPEFGNIAWKVPIELVLAMDKIFDGEVV